MLDWKLFDSDLIDCFGGNENIVLASELDLLGSRIPRS